MTVKIDGILNVLEEKKQRWGQMKPSQRLAYLVKIRNSFLQKVNGYEWAERSLELQGIDISTAKGKSSTGLEYVVSTMTVKNHLDGLIKTYRDFVKAGDTYDIPCPKLRTTQAKDGRFIVHPPATFAEKLLDTKVELFIEQGHNPSKENRQVNKFAGKTCLCLGAGNQTFLTLSDVFHKLFVDGQTVLVKHHPLREFSAPFFDIMFAEMIEDGFLAHVVCDLETTKALYLDDRIDTLHMTGGKPTHDLIIKTLREHGKEKPFTSELGNVTPWIIPSGGESWTEKELRRTLSSLVTGVIAQQSCNCLSPKVLVLDEDWSNHDQCINVLKTMLAEAKLPPAYYPGLKDRYDKFVQAYRYQEDEKQAKNVHVEQIDSEWIDFMDASITPESEKAPQPTLFIHHVVDTEDEESNRDLFALRNEPFAPIFVVISLKGGKNNTRTFLDKAVPFVNDFIFGTLSCSMSVHRSLEKDEAVQDALENLRYGMICMNAWTAMGFSLPNAVWGGYKESMDHVQSGVDLVHNCLMIPHVEKAVVRYPFMNSLQSERGDAQLPPVKLLKRVGKFIERPGVFSAVGILSAATIGW